MQTVTFTILVPDDIAPADVRLLVLTGTDDELTGLGAAIGKCNAFIAKQADFLGQLHDIAARDGKAAAWATGPLALLREDAVDMQPTIEAVCAFMLRAEIYPVADLPTAGRA